jgi:hypothetical protein
MATSPANASAIKYAVMSFSRSELKLRHDRLRDHFRREPYLHQMEAACGRGLGPRRLAARSRVPANEGESCFLKGRSDACSEITAQHYKVRTAARLRRSGDAGEGVAP